MEFFQVIIKKVIFRNYISLNFICKLKDLGVGEFIIGKIALY